MKSSYELALERTGGTLEDVDKAVKGKIAKIDIKYKSKIAEAELSAQERIIKAGGDIAEIKIVKEDMVVELASIRSKAEREKEAVRNGKN